MNPLATAQRLVKKHGGNVTLRKYARTAGTPSTPWRGPGGTLADSRTEKAVIITREQAQATVDARWAINMEGQWRAMEARHAARAQQARAS